MKRTPLPKQQIKLQFVTNKWNDYLQEAFIDGFNVASIEFDHTVKQFFLYTAFTNRNAPIAEGYFDTREQAESRANWRANL